MTQLVKTDNEMTNIMEQVMLAGDLTKLTAKQRVDYYSAVCQSVGLNPLTRPFDYIRLNGRLTLYARKDATEQLRSLHNVSIIDTKVDYTDDLVVVNVTARNGDGRTDSDLGAVTIRGLSGDNLANAIMKAITKAKRRVTLSICGLGWLDELELETIPSAQEPNINIETGEIGNEPARQAPDENFTWPSNIEPHEKQPLMNTPVGGFIDMVVDLQDDYDNVLHVRNALKKIGYEAIPGRWQDRVQMFSELRERKHNPMDDVQVVEGEVDESEEDEIPF